MIKYFLLLIILLFTSIVYSDGAPIRGISEKFETPYSGLPYIYDFYTNNQVELFEEEVYFENNLIKAYLTYSNTSSNVANLQIGFPVISNYSLVFYVMDPNDIKNYYYDVVVDLKKILKHNSYIKEYKDYNYTGEEYCFNYHADFLSSDNTCYIDFKVIDQRTGKLIDYQYNGSGLYIHHLEILPFKAKKILYQYIQPINFDNSINSGYADLKYWLYYIVYCMDWRILEKQYKKSKIYF